MNEEMKEMFEELEEIKHKIDKMEQKFQKMGQRGGYQRMGQMGNYGRGQSMGGDRTLWVSLPCTDRCLWVMNLGLTNATCRVYLPRGRLRPAPLI